MPIFRMFNATDDAIAAVAELKRDTSGRVPIRLIATSEDDASVVEMQELGVPEAQARRFAERVSGGGALVIADAPFGLGRTTTEVLERSRPSDTGLSQVLETRARQSSYGGGSGGVTHDDATPLSSALNIPVLLNNPAPLSSFLKLPTLSQRQAPKTSSFGMPLLSNDAAPFSSWLGLPTLSPKAAPFSSWLGWKVLTDDPAPLSSLLNMPVLLKKRTFLS